MLCLDDYFMSEKEKMEKGLRNGQDGEKTGKFLQFPFSNW